MFVLRLMFPTLTHQVSLHALDVMEVCLRASMRWGALTPSYPKQASRCCHRVERMVHITAKGTMETSSGKLQPARPVTGCPTAPLLSTSYHLHPAGMHRSSQCSYLSSALRAPAQLVCRSPAMVWGDAPSQRESQKNIYPCYIYWKEEKVINIGQFDAWNSKNAWISARHFKIVMHFFAKLIYYVFYGQSLRLGKCVSGGFTKALFIEWIICN
jgi:hypothetical protein